MTAPSTPDPHRKRHAGRVVKALARAYPEAFCALKHRDAFELVVATILSAQCTDARVNLVTPALFERYPHARALADADPGELESIIRSTGFFRDKARNLIAMARGLVEQHHGEVPRDLDDLTRLGGVGRKTANVVLGTAFGIASGIVVDTHVRRLTQRLGLTERNDPVKIEQDLIAVIPPKEWVNFSHRLISHGRAVCTARKPLCDACSLASICPKIGVDAASRPKPKAAAKSKPSDESTPALSKPASPQSTAARRKRSTHAH